MWIHPFGGRPGKISDNRLPALSLEQKSRKLLLCAAILPDMVSRGSRKIGTFNCKETSAQAEKNCKWQQLIFQITRSPVGPSSPPVLLSNFFTSFTVLLIAMLMETRPTGTQQKSSIIGHKPLEEVREHDSSSIADDTSSPRHATQ